MLQRFTKRRKLLTAVMLLCFCAFTNNAMAQTWNIGHPGYNANVKATLSGNTLTISGNGNMCDFWDSSEGEAPWWFNTTHRNTIQTVIIQSNVTNIGNRAFKDCGNLRTVTITSSVKIIGRQAFFNCTNANFTQIIIPNSVTEIEGEAFKNCSNLRTITIENGYSQLNFTGFYYYGYEYEGGWKYDWFYGCPIQTLHLGRDCKYSSIYPPFRGISTLQNLTIGNSVGSIFDGNYAAFANCGSLTNVTIEDSTNALSCQPNTFTGSPVRILYFGRNIPSSPFSGAISLTTLIIGSNVTSMGSFFQSGLTTITSKNPNPPTTSDNCFYNVYKTCKLYVPKGSSSKYNNANQPEWKKFFDNGNGFEEGNNGIEKVLANQLEIFPNPAKDEIFIKSDLMIEKFEIYSLTGSLLLSENNFDRKISVSALSDGIYLLKVYTDKGVAVSKIVKE